ncbi:hypothetical protein H4219_003153 [Mycoemilia scoparia]|uniref:CP-type G domain-containing protein n=1 Tax=Mycoemilia scoparia TaxID=417184 RepID=A0A9W8A231_9FUNG|nr:hypothetical protein H4219_003153 [Mycoemilia scoparia]
MPPKSKTLKGNLGRAIIKKRFQGRDPDDYTATLHSTELPDGPSWTRLQSITQQGDLEEFLHTAELAGTEFTAERGNIKIISTQDANPFLLTPEEEKLTLQKHKLNEEKLKIPRRPDWDETMAAEELHKRERDIFINWRRDLAKLQEEEGFLLTPFERNLEVWRQLWRVLERSHLVVQIVDARNPLLFRCIDVEKYVNEIDPRKVNMLLVNKADMLTRSQRALWAKHFKEQGISFVFFSAKASSEKAEEPQDDDGDDDVSDELSEQSMDDSPKIDENDNTENTGAPAKSPEEIEDSEEKGDDEDTAVLSAEELVDLMVSRCPPLANEHTQFKAMIGLIGYPNVGKSSTINALVGAKRVSVGSMPGKTKHFQTIHLTDDIVLCDCPGLVFPTFATTKADMVCNGVLPIDQLREYTGPAELVAQRIPKFVLESTYGIKIHTKPEEEGGTGVPTSEEFLVSYAAARGLTKSGQGNPDEARAARYILKDYVNGKLLYNHPPPGVNGKEFNDEINTSLEVAKRCKNFVENEDGEYVVKHAASDRANVEKAVVSSISTKSTGLDSEFFGTDKSRLAPKLKGQSLLANRQVHRANLYAPIHGIVDDQGNISSDRSGVTAAIQAAKQFAGNSGKKHKKGKKNRKARSGEGTNLY